jgi:hypothetical protein
MQEIADSFCERCGTRYTFSAAPVKGPALAGARLLAKGLKNFVMSDGTSLDEAMEAARIDSGHDESVRVAEEFHKTFNFCMSCRQYACEKCWNENQGACLSCAPLWDTPAVAPQDHLIMRMPVSRLNQEGGLGRRIGTPSGSSNGQDRAQIEWPAADLQPAASNDEPAVESAGSIPAIPEAPVLRAEAEPGGVWSGIEPGPALACPVEPDQEQDRRHETPTAPAEPSGSPAEFRTPSWVTRKEEDASEELQARSESWKSNDDGWSLWPADEAPRTGGRPGNAASDRAAPTGEFVDAWLAGGPGRMGSRDGWLGAEPSMPPAKPVLPAPIGSDSATGEPSAEADGTARQDEPGPDMSLTAEELAVIQAGLSGQPRPNSSSHKHLAEPEGAAAEPQEQPAWEAADDTTTVAEEPDIRLQLLASLGSGSGMEEAARLENAAPIVTPPAFEPAPPEEPQHQHLMARLLGRRQRPEEEQPATARARGAAEETLPAFPGIPTGELPVGQWPRPTRWLDRPVEAHDWWAEEDQAASPRPEEIGPAPATFADTDDALLTEGAGTPVAGEAATADFAMLAGGSPVEPVAFVEPEPAPERVAPAAPAPEPAPVAGEAASSAPKQDELFGMPDATTDRWPMPQPNVPAGAPAERPTGDLPDWAVAARLGAGSLEPAPGPEPAEPASWPPLGATWPARDRQSSPWQMPTESAPPPRTLAAHRADQAELAESPLVAALWEESSQQVLDQGNVRVCHNCALPISTHARFCRRCGTRQE